MRKTVLMLLSLLFVGNVFAGSDSTDSVAITNESENRWGEGEWWDVHVKTSVTPRQHDMVSWFSFFGVTVEPVKRFKVGVDYVNFLGLHNSDGEKRYFTSNGIGGSVAYRVYCDSKRPRKGIDAQFRFAHSLGNADMKYTLYDIGAEFYDRVGIGFRIVDSHTSGIRNTNCVYFSIGI